MPEQEPPEPRVIVYLTLLVPICVAICFGAIEWVSGPGGRPLSLGLPMRAAGGALLVMIPAALHASRRQPPGRGMFLLAFAPVLLGVAIPLARYRGLVSPMWAMEAIASETLSTLQSTWQAAAAGAWTSAQVAATYAIVAGAWPDRAAAAGVPWRGRERMVLLVAGPVFSLLAVACWKLAGLPVMASDVLVWVAGGLPAVVLALGPGVPRRAGESLRTISAAVACVFLLTLAAQAARVGEASAILVSRGSAAGPAMAAQLPRELLVRWFVTGIVAAFAVLALVPGRVHLRRPRHLRVSIAWPMVAALGAVAVGALVPGMLPERAMARARARWVELLRSRDIRLPSCTAAVPLAPGPLFLVTPEGQVQTFESPGGTVKIAASQEMPAAALFRALPQLPSGASIEFVVAGCEADGPSARRGEAAQGKQRGVRATWLRKLACGGTAETVQVLLESEQAARVQRNACGGSPSSPVLMDIASARALAEGKAVVAGVAEGVSLGDYLEVMTRAWPGAAVHGEPTKMQAAMDEAATREMLVHPGTRRATRGVLAVLASTASGTRRANPEALQGPIRGGAGLYRCFEHVDSEMRWGMALELGEEGAVRSSVVEGEGTAGLATCVAGQAQSMSFPDAAGTRRVEAKLAWYPPALRGQDGLTASGALTVRAEAETVDVRGADVLAARLAPYFGRCIGEAWQDDAELTGSAVLRVCVTPTGMLEASGAESSRIPRAALECVRDSVKLVRAEPEQTPSREQACFRVASELSRKAPAPYQLTIDVQEAEREGGDKGEGEVSENAARARALGPEVLTCFGHPSGVGELDGELTLSLHPNRWGRVMRVLVRTHGILDARLVRCAVEAATRMQVFVEPGAAEAAPKLVVTMKVTDSALGP